MERKGSRAESDALRIVIFLIALAVIAFHPITRCSVEALAGHPSSQPRECWTEGRGALYCLDSDGQTYRAR
jgi:hypothetical protein